MATSKTVNKEQLNVIHNQEKHQFFINLDPPDTAVLDYDVKANGSVDMHHTEVPPSYRGQGVAGVLAKAAFSHFTGGQTKMLLTCTYLQKYYRENPDASKPELITVPAQK